MRTTRVWLRVLGVEHTVVESVDVDSDRQGELLVARVLVKAGQAFRCSRCRRRCARYDRQAARRQWGLDLGATRVVLEADTYRVSCPEHGIVVANVPWARPGGRFTTAAVSVHWNMSAGIARNQPNAWRSCMGRTTSGIGLVPVLIIGGVVAAVVFGVDMVIDTVTGFFSGGTEIIGEGAARVMVAGSAKSETKQCTTQQMINNKRCGDRKVLVVDAAKMPFIARNTKLAWESGRPAVLTMNRPKQPANRQAACGKFVHKYPPPIGSCDEYPMAATAEGGAAARTEEVPARENLCQGGSYRPQYPKDSEKFLVVIQHPDLIAPAPFAGIDIAKEQGLC